MSPLIWILLFVFGVRAVSLLPSVIDIDEAWFAASGAAMRVPSEFFQRAIDNKPPGTAWFFWLVEKISHAGSDPRPARLACLVLIALSAWLVGEIATVFAPERKRLAILLFLLASALPSPECLATTTEALTMPATCLMILMLARALDQGKSSAPGLVAAAFVFGSTLVFKQTAVFLFLPAIYGLYILHKAQRLSTRSAIAIAIGALTPLALTMVTTGAAVFVHWTIDYPMHVLAQARQKTFSQNREFLVHTLVTLAAFWPLLPTAARLGRLRATVMKQQSLRLLWLWLAATLLGVSAGKGLFFHYFIPLSAPLAVLAAIWVPPDFIKTKGLRWLVLLYCAVCIGTIVPGLGVFWGTDLAYYEKLGQSVHSLTNTGDHIFVWGGSALPLVTSGRLHSTRFVTARFLVPRYSTPGIQENFRRDFERDPPALLVDTHRRGDSGINMPPADLPWLARVLRTQYRAFEDPRLPWVTFYRHGGVARAPAADYSTRLEFEALYKEFGARLRAQSQRPLLELTWLAFTAPTRFSHLLELSRLLQAWDGLRALSENPQIREKAPLALANAGAELRAAINQEFAAALDPAARHTTAPQLAASYLRWLDREFRWNKLAPPLSFETWNWVSTIALVELQPVTTPRELEN